jgi:hypothetical protein
MLPSCPHGLCFVVKWLFLLLASGHNGTFDRDPQPVLNPKADQTAIGRNGRNNRSVSLFVMQMQLKSKFIAILLGLMVSSQSFGQLVPVGIPRASFNFVAASQQQTEWCWAASSQMILQWYGLRVTQQDVVTRVYGALIDAPGSDNAITAALNAVAVSTDGQLKAVHAVSAAGPPPPSVLIDQLSQKHPILMTFMTGPYSGHAIVITAATYFPTPQGPIINSIIIRDPWPTPATIATDGRVEIAGPALGSFLPSVSKHWLVWTTPVGAFR